MENVQKVFKRIWRKRQKNSCRIFFYTKRHKIEPTLAKVLTKTKNNLGLRSSIRIGSNGRKPSNATDPLRGRIGMN
jgi:hypothetical protein